MGEKLEEGILLIHPPLTRACEAPAGVARLAGALRGYGVPCRVWDANLEGQHVLMEDTARAEAKGCDTWTYRASRRYEENLAALRFWKSYCSEDTYGRVVRELNRLLAVAGRPFGVRMSLTDYEDSCLSPLRSEDLLRAAHKITANPFGEWFAKRIEEVLKESPFSHIGLSLNYLSQALTTFMMIGYFRCLHPERRIILGGSLVTSWMAKRPRRGLFAGLVDEVVIGPGEARLLAIFGKEYKGGKGHPSFENLPMNNYLSPGIVLPYSAAEGCWWGRCLFCPEAAEGRNYKVLPLALIRDELAFLVEKLNPSLIHFLDNALSPALLRDLAGRPLGVPWYGFSRFVPELEDPSFCRELRASGCVMLQLGLESADERVLNALRKGIDPAAARRILENLAEAGIGTYVYLLFGTPAETREAAIRTMAFIMENSQAIDYLNLAIFNLPANGAMDWGVEAGEFYRGDLSLYRSFSHPSGWDRPQVRRFLEEEFKKEQKIAEIMRRDPPFFTSNHAPFFKALSVPG